MIFEEHQFSFGDLASSMQSTSIILFVALVGCALACAPGKPVKPAATTTATTEAETTEPTTETPAPGRKRRGAGDVVIVLRTNEVYKAGQNAVHLKTVRQKLAAFARANGVDSSYFRPHVQNVQGRFAARIEIVGGIGYCKDVKRFVKGALYELPEVTDAKVKCGDALGQTISRN